jgi:hypothetical protein
VSRRLERGEREMGVGRGSMNSGGGARLLYGPGEQRGGVAGAVSVGVTGYNAIEGVKGR